MATNYHRPALERVEEFAQPLFGIGCRKERITTSLKSF